jgi:hypothetical protein
VSSARLFAQARAVLQGNLELTPGDELVIVWDETVSADLIDALRHAAIACDIPVFVLTCEPRSYGPNPFGGAAPDRRQPMPAVLAGAMEGANAIALAAGGINVKPYLERGARACSLHYLTTEAALRLLPGSVEEVRELRERTERGKAIMERARRARVTSPAGTDFTCELGQYRGLTHNGVIAPGTRQILPAGQVTRVPNDRTLNGVVVVDRSIGGNDFKPLPEAVRFVVKDGYVTAVEGGAEADKVRRWLAGLDHPEIYHVTELAFGTNSRCRLTGVTAPSEDTHTAGCVSVALGADVHIGGSTVAPTHVDMTMFFGTLELDGEVVVRDGVLAY